MIICDVRLCVQLRDGRPKVLKASGISSSCPLAFAAGLVGLAAKIQEYAPQLPLTISAGDIVAEFNPWEVSKTSDN